MKKKVNKKKCFFLLPFTKNFISVGIGVREHITIIKVTRPDSFITKHRKERMKTCEILFNLAERKKFFFARTHKPQNLNSSYSNECLNKKKGNGKEIPKII